MVFKVWVVGYCVGGKMGMVYKVEGGVYVRKYVVFFVGFVLISDLCFIVVVMIDELIGGVYYGGDVVGLVFLLIIGGVLWMMGVLQDVLFQVVEVNVGKGWL